MPYYTPVTKSDTGYNVQNFVRDLENHYQNVMFIVSQLCGIYTRAEYHTSEGRIDMTMATSDYVYIWEFKFENLPRKHLIR